MEAYVSIFNQIQELRMKSKEKGQLKMLQFTGYGEPLLNRELPQMIRMARDGNVSQEIDVTTNAALLTHELSLKLVESGLTRLSVSIQGLSDGKYKEISGKELSVDKLVDNIRFFYENKEKCKVFIKILNVCLDSPSEQALFYKTFTGISDTMFIENCIEASDGIDFQKIIPKSQQGLARYGNEIVKKNICDALFYSILITSWGDVTPCCKYPMLSLGNIFNQPLCDIWNGNTHTTYMQKHLLGRSSEIPLCNNCVALSSYSLPEDNLDPYAEIILAKLNGGTL
jgi:radical SAM protein with 4Fe4S-binding SPASM domain